MPEMWRAFANVRLFFVLLVITNVYMMVFAVPIKGRVGHGAAAMFDER